MVQIDIPPLDKLLFNGVSYLWDGLIVPRLEFLTDGIAKDPIPVFLLTMIIIAIICMGVVGVITVNWIRNQL